MPVRFLGELEGTPARVLEGTPSRVFAVDRPSTLSEVIGRGGLVPAGVHAVVVNGRPEGDLSRVVGPEDTVWVFGPRPLAGECSAVLEECGPQPGCPSLDPGTRVKTHRVRVTTADGECLWERSIYSQYDTRDVWVTGPAVLLGYDDRVVVLDWATGEVRRDHRMYLFEYFEELGRGEVMVKEKGSILLLDRRGDLLWEHGSSQVLETVLVHGPDHVFVHFWGGSEVAGLTVPFACLSVATGQVDLEGPPTAPPFDRLADRADIARPRDRDGAARMRDNVRRLASEHHSVWIRAMLEYVNE